MTKAIFNNEILKTLKKQYFRGKMREEDRQNLLFEQYGETVPSFRVLSYLANHPEGVEPSVIADDLWILRQTITSIADHLENEGFVERCAHPTDRRKILLKVTDDGLVKGAELLSVFKDYHSRITSHFTKKELDEYFRMRDRLYDVRDEVVCEMLKERGVDVDNSKLANNR